VEGYDVKMKTVLEKMLKKRGIKRTGIVKHKIFFLPLG
jgi:hypothetical protein